MAVIRYTITGVLELLGALHVGSGAGGQVGAVESYTDATIVRDSRGRPYIPGSSLRGVLRAAVAQLAPSLEQKTIRDDSIIKTLVDEAREMWVRQHKREPEEGELQMLLEGELAPVERLFGTVYWASPLTIPDLAPLDDTAIGGEIRHGVGIDRDTGAAQEKIKYDFEALPRGTHFRFLLRCDMPADLSRRRDWLQLLGLGLRLLEQGELTLGGKAARGLGQIRLGEVQVYRLDRGNRQALLRALTTDGPTAAYGMPMAEPETWARRALRGEVD